MGGVQENGKGGGGEGGEVVVGVWEMEQEII